MIAKFLKEGSFAFWRLEGDVAAKSIRLFRLPLNLLDQLSTLENERFFRFCLIDFQPQ